MKFKRSAKASKIPFCASCPLEMFLKTCSKLRVNPQNFGLVFLGGRTSPCFEPELELLDSSSDEPEPVKITLKANSNPSFSFLNSGISKL